jgi:tripartite-type tricarboxylate transporter receptor subunit TctC
MIEAGLPGYESTLSYGILAPRGTPEPIVREIQQQLSKAVASPKLKEMLAAEGAVPLAGTGTQFASLIKAETEKWGKVIKEGGIQAD